MSWVFSVLQSATVTGKILIGVSFLLTQAAFGKCPQTQYDVSGTITASSGMPIANAIVSVRWKEREHYVNAPDVVSDSAGTYKTLVDFNSFSGSKATGMDQCSGKLHWFEISVTASGYRAKKEIVATPVKESPISVSISLLRK